jgi:hypothetical protein
MNSKVINIDSATQIEKYKLRLTFDDGVVQEVDFGAFLGKAQHPDIRAYLDENRFNAFRLEYGGLVWGDYDLCFPIMDLYLNQIDKHVDLQAVA